MRQAGRDRERERETIVLIEPVDSFILTLDPIIVVSIF